MLNFARLFEINFWFTLRPSALGERTVMILAVGFAVLLALAIFLKIFSKTKKQNPPLVKLLRKLQKMLSVMAFVGFVLLFLSYEQIYLLGAHFWFLAWLLGLIVWMVFIVLYAFRKMPAEKSELEKKQKFLKYLSR